MTPIFPYNLKIKWFGFFNFTAMLNVNSQKMFMAVKEEWRLPMAKCCEFTFLYNNEVLIKYSEVKINYWSI